MPLSRTLVGRTIRGHVTHVDSRWLMAYAAASASRLGTTPSPALMRPPHPAHPLFVWGVHWPLMWDRFSELVGGSGDDSVLTAAESARAVHYSERIDIAQAIEAGDELRTDATIVAVDLRPGGATLLTRFDTRLAGDDFRTVCVSWSGSYYRGVELLGPAHALPDLLPPVLPPPPPPSTSSASLSPTLSAGTMPDCVTITPAITGKQDQGARPLLKEMIDITAVEAHIYSECARIWNPIVSVCLTLYHLMPATPAAHCLLLVLPRRTLSLLSYTQPCVIAQC